MARGWINPKFKNLKPIIEKVVDAARTVRGWVNPKYASQLEEPKVEQPTIEEPTIEPTPPAEKSYEPSVLDLKKTEYYSLFNEAYNRMLSIKDANLMSAALMSFESEGDFIPLSDIQTEEELFTEVTRVRAFLADETSTIQGAKDFTAESIALAKYGKAFEYENRDYRKYGYNPDTEESFPMIDFHREQAAWATFRELRANDQAWISDHYGYGGRATQAIVAQIYDELEGVPDNELVTWVMTDEGLKSSGLVNTRVNNLMHDRLERWQKIDSQTQHLSKSFASHNTGNFSYTGDTGDILTEREF